MRDQSSLGHSLAHQTAPRRAAPPSLSSHAPVTLLAGSAPADCGDSLRISEWLLTLLSEQVRAAQRHASKRAAPRRAAQLGLICSRRCLAGADGELWLCGIQKTSPSCSMFGRGTCVRPVRTSPAQHSARIMVQHCAAPRCPARAEPHASLLHRCGSWLETWAVPQERQWRWDWDRWSC